jgi:glycosyltransferase involved in cell wall biosynthesis
MLEDRKGLAFGYQLAQSTVYFTSRRICNALCRQRIVPMSMKRLYVLVSQEPDLDPRIDWVSQHATGLFQVVVFGMASQARPKPARECHHGYQIQRLEPSRKGLFSFAWAFLRYVCANRLLGVTLLSGLLLSMFLVPKLCRFLLPGIILIPVRLIMRAFVRGCSRLPWFGRHLTSFLNLYCRSLSLARHFVVTAIAHYRAIRQHPRPDLIYCNDLDTLLAGIFLKSHFGCKLIYDAHEFWAHADPASSPAEVRFFLSYERKLLAHVDAAFTVNHLLAEQMSTASGYDFGALPNCEPLFPFAKRAAGRASHNSVATAMPLADMSDERTVTEIAGGRVRFLFQGGFAPERGVLELLTAWQHVDPSKAVLLLRGPDNQYKTECIELARQLGILRRSVFFPEPVRESALVAAATEADVGVIPYKAVTVNYRFCCPNKLSQYMKAGLAILANELDFVRYAIDRFQCGLTYDVNDQRSILAAVNRLIDDKCFRHACQQQAKKMANQEYNWETVSQPLYETCARLTGLEVGKQGGQAPASRVA